MFDSLFMWVYELFYGIDVLLCKILAILYEVFEVFAGVKKVKYGETYKYLISIFYNNSAINIVYWGMVLISMALLIFFTIMAVIKKSFDIGDKMKSGLGDIIRNALKGGLFILLIQFILLASINMTNILMEAVTNVFNIAALEGHKTTITFDNADYATMARVLNTIGNYSVNPSRQSRYNVNSCFNEIRTDMQRLKKKGVFDFNYEKTDSKGNKITSWQLVLTDIANARDLSSNIDLDEYDIALTNAMSNAMDVISTSGSAFKPLKEQTWKSDKDPLNPKNVSIDNLLFLTATTTAAKNKEYNKNPGIYDNLRYDYLSGKKSIYDLDQVKEDFDISFSTFDHLICIIGALILGQQFMVLALNCVARIFNMMILYVMAPPFIAVMPYDEGGKAKQWTTAFVIQSLSVFGSVVSIRLFMIFVPIIFDSNLVLLENGVGEILAKLVFLFGAAFTCNKASGMISGILADNAGLQSIQAGDVGSGAFAKMKSMAGSAASIAAKPITTPAKAIASRAGKEMGDALYKGAKTAGGAVIKAPFKAIGAAGRGIGRLMGISGSKSGGSKAGEAGKKNGGSGNNNSGSKSNNAGNNKNNNGGQCGGGQGGGGGGQGGHGAGGHGAGGQGGGQGGGQPNNADTANNDAGHLGV